MSALRARFSLRPVRVAPRPRLLLVPLLLVTAIAVARPAEAATAVSVKIGVGPKRISRATGAMFRWKTHGTVLRTMCALDRQRFGRCSKRKLYKKLKNGPHRFRVEAIGVGTAKRIATYKWRIDNVPPTVTVVAGGSLAWQNIASLPLTGSGSSDSGSGVLRYEWRSSSDGGATWSTGAPGGLVTVTAAGETMAQFRAVDRAGNASAWSPAAGTAAATARIDRVAPSMPVVTGGSLQWQNAVTVDVIASGSVDVGGAGVDHYEYRTSTDGGLLWSSGVAGNDASIGALGKTLVEFRAVDAAGNSSLWAPLIDNGGNTVWLDRTIPTAPTVAGGTAGWQNIVSTTVTASGGQDSFGSGVAGYEYRLSTDGGSTWSSPAAGATIGISSEGQTLVEFHSVDNASLLSSWTQVAVEIDRTNPTDPAVSGGSPAWQSVASLDIAAGGSSDSGGSGLVGYQVRSSTDGGSTWTTAAAGADQVVSAEGQTLVELRAIDGAGNVSSWIQDTVRIDRTLPTAPVVSGGSLSWQSAASVAVSAAGSTDGGGSGLVGYKYRSSTDGGSTWSVATAGASDAVSSEGQTLVQLRSIDGAGNTSAWAPAAAGAANTVRLDRIAPSVPTVTGSSLSWLVVASVTPAAGGATDPGGSGVTGYEFSTSTNGGATWTVPAAGASVPVSAEGETLVEFRSLDAVGNRSAWVQATVRLDRTAPSAPAVAGGSLSWLSVVSVTISASASLDTGGSGLAGYQYRASADGGATWSSSAAGASDVVSAEGAYLVQFQAVDGAGNSSAWAPAVSGAASTVRIDRSPPTAPTSVTGGSLSWQSVASVTITAAGGTDSNFAGYDYRTSTNGGVTWSAATAGSSFAVVAQGTTIVQFRSRDLAGNVSAWTPAIAGAANTAAIDRTIPSIPTVTGGSLTWKTLASVTVSGAGSTDATSGILRYEYRTSTNGGGTWSAATAGASVAVSTEGTTLVQFRAVDNAGNMSAWAPAVAGAGNTVKLDRIAASLPTVSGGLGAGTCKRKLTVVASGSTDVGGSGFLHYDYRLSTNGGATWAATVTNRSSVKLSATGTYLVQFHAVDVAGNISAWAPAVAGNGNTACIL